MPHSLLRLCLTGGFSGLRSVGSSIRNRHLLVSGFLQIRLFSAGDLFPRLGDHGGNIHLVDRLIEQAEAWVYHHLIT